MVLADINEEGAQAAAEESSKVAKHSSFKAIAVKVDITDEASVDNMVAAALKEFGRIDYNVNSAGVCHLPHIVHILRMTDSRESPVRQHLWRYDAKHQSRWLLSYHRHQCPRHYAVCASCLEGYGRTRTAQLREPSFWIEKSWSRLDRQSGVCELLYCGAGHDAVYRVETRHRWSYEDCWYVKLSVAIISWHRA